MLLTHEHQTVDLDLDFINSFEKIGISLSGGTDSALLFYLVCKFAPNVTIVPWCGIDVYRSANVEYAREIYKVVVERFPDVNIKPLYEFDIDVKDPYWIELSKTIPNHANLKDSGFIKQVICGQKSAELFRSGDVQMNINALTANPPRDVAIELGFIDKCEERRFSVDNETKLRGIYKPFRNVDKKWVAGMYEKFGLMDWLYPWTQSCVGFAKDTDFFTRPCEKCFWCHEKKWAFGTYDLCFDL